MESCGEIKELIAISLFSGILSISTLLSQELNTPASSMMSMIQRIVSKLKIVHNGWYDRKQRPFLQCNPLAFFYRVILGF